MPNDIANNMADTIHQLEEDRIMLSAQLTDLQITCNEQMLELKEAKRLLKAAVEDIYNARRGINCEICDMPKNNIETEKRCEVDNVQPECKYRWRHADEALKLIES